MNWAIWRREHRSMYLDSLRLPFALHGYQRIQWQGYHWDSSTRSLLDMTGCI